MAEKDQKNAVASNATDKKTVAEQKPFGSSPGWQLWLASLAASLVALAVYGCTLAGYLYPGESASLYTQWTGIEMLSLPIHPVWGWVVSSFSGVSATSLNSLGLVCGVLSAGFLCYLVGFFVYQTISQEDTVKHVRAASLVAGCGSAVAFIFSIAVWNTSTHQDVRQFDVFLALAVFMLYIPLVRFPRLTYVLAPVIGFAVAVGLLEGVVFVPLTAVYLLALVAAIVKNGYKFYVPTAMFLVALVVGYLLLANNVADAYLRLPSSVGGEYETASDVIWACLNSHKQEMYQWLFGKGGIVVNILAVLPFIACTFVASRGLNNERSWSQYLFHAAMTVCCVLATATPLTPESLLNITGRMPVATTTLVAATCGYLLAYWFLLMRVPIPVAEYDDKTLPVLKIGRKAAPFVGYGLAVLLMLAGIVNAFSRDGDSGKFADICANEILERMGSSTWLITEGVLDANLRVAAAARGQELHIIAIMDRSEQKNVAYCNRLADLIEEKGVTAGKKTKEDLAFTLRELGLLSFLKMWFGNDPDIVDKVKTVGWPDFWFWAHCRPVPECLIFRGVRDEKTVDGLKVKSDFEAFWQKIEPILTVDRYRGKGSRALFEVESMADRYRLNLRRHLGLIANNIGVLLQNLGHDNEAFEMYELVLGTIDCDNVCALFNEIEMAYASKPVAQAQARKREVEQQFKSIVADNSRRYYIEMLSVAYGYIRSPMYFIRNGVRWAKAGGMGYALENLKYASDLVPGGTPPKELQNMMAGLYAEDGQKELSREIYNDILKKDAANYDALMGLWKLSLLDGATDEAKSYLKKAEKAKVRDGVVRLEVPLQYMMDNNLDEAHEALKQIGFQQPSARVWALDAGVMLMLSDKAKDSSEKQRILAEVENGILPKMEQLSDSPHDFHVQMTRAFVLMRKGKDPETLKQARAALDVAWQSRPVVAVGGMVLDMDFRLQDRESAERHAKQILRLDENHPFANWVLGSIRMSEEKLAEAERYLRVSAGGEHPYAPAQNDLADLLRRRGSLVEAEEFARAATESAPQLYVTWETLSATLLERGKDLDEAERCIHKALELPEGKEDPRMQLTLARVQIAKKDFANARKTLRALEKHREELTSDRDKATLDALREQAEGK